MFPAWRIPGVSASSTSTATGWVTLIVVSSVVYQAFLAGLHTHVLRTSALYVAAAEFLLYLGCLLVLARRIRMTFAALATLVMAYLLLLSIFRDGLDFKGFRDVLIPLLFYWLGRHIGDIAYADRVLKGIVVVVLAFAFFELFFLPQYTALLDIFSYYVSTGTVTISTNYISDSALNLNGLRPEGIGRTIFPALLGSHRVSSVFLEPVSLGNFAVIVAAWGLSKQRAEYRTMLFFVASAAVLIALADSRYGLIVGSSLIVIRMLVSGRTHLMFLAAPFVSIVALLLVGLTFDGGLADNIMGRLYWTGDTLLQFDLGKIIGVEGFDIPYGDMGYAYLLSRWGVALCLVLWGALWLIRMPDARGERFRAYAALYSSLILTVSGTSFFALKTAGLLWFLLGSCSDRRVAHPRSSPVAAPSRLPESELSYAH